jgi:YD repeat-containing protein
MVTRLFSQPVNFRNAQDDWQRIDPTLVAADQAGYVHQRANDGDVLIPTGGLTRPVRVERDGTWVSLRLRGGEDASVAVVQGDTARYDDAAQSTDATYQATNTGVKETLTLADASAPSQFAYDLDASSGLTPHAVDDGGIELRDATGKPLFRLTAPVVWDAASGPSDPEPASVSVQAASSGWVLRLTIDEAWLSDPARAFPVTVDPNVQWLAGGTMRYSRAQRDCTVASGDLATTSLCTEPTVRVGSDGSHTYKSLLFFDTPRAIWQDAEIEDTTLLLHVGGTGTAPTSNLRVRAITDSWTNAATWNSRDGSTAWATPGGDVSQAAADVGLAAPIAGLNAWYRWPVPAEVVQRWTWGTQSDFGVQLSADSGSPEAVYAFESTENDPYKWPALDIYWTPYKGDKPSFTQDVQRTSDHSQIAVNVANGSAKYTTQDLTLPGPAGDIPITMDRQWLSNQSYTVKAFGYGWSHPYEQSTLRINADGSGFYVDTTGAPHRFASNGSGGFAAPADLDATLCKIQDTGTACTRDGVSGVSYKLTYPGAGLSYYFWSSGRLGTLRDTAGHAVRADWTSTHNTFTGSDNRAVTLNIDSSGWYSPSMVEGTRTWLFSRDAKDNLLTATLPTGGVATYEYNSDRLLTKITEPDGNQTRLEWGKLSRGSIVVTKVIHVLDAADPTNPAKNPTTTYSYDFPNHNTVVTDPAGNATATPTDDGQTTYHYDERLNVTSASPGASALPAPPAWSNPDAAWDTDRPTATPSGAWYDKRDGYVNGQGQQTVILGASDARSGVRRVALEEVGGSELAAYRAPCTGISDPPATCSSSVSPTVSFETGALSEGVHHYRQTVQDLAGNSGRSAPWTVTVDRSAPSVPGDFLQGMFYPDDPDPVVTISWAETTDPVLADGSPGSGIADYDVRYSVNSGPLSAWATADGTAIEIAGVAVGTAVHIEVRARDAAGNASGVGSANITIVPQLEDPDLLEMAAEYHASDTGDTLTVSREWMKVQARTNGLESAVHASASSGAGYAGMWFDDPNHEVVVNLKSGTSPVGAQQAIDDAGLTNDARIAFTKNTLAELDAGYDAIRDQLTDQLARSVIRQSRDDQGNMVRIEVATDATSADRARVAQAASSATVDVAVVNDTVANYSTQELACRKTTSVFWPDRRDACDPPLRGGTVIGGENDDEAGQCTGSFIARGRDNNAPLLLTAGHCMKGKTLGSPFTRFYAYESNSFPVDLGAPREFYNGVQGDAGVINIPSDWQGSRLRPWVFMQSNGHGLRRNPHHLIRLVQTSHPHQVICISGARTGGHCGKVLATRVTADKYRNMGLMKACGILEGDSGGPIVGMGGSARGLVSFTVTANPCHVGFQSARLAQDGLGVDILTQAP